MSPILQSVVQFKVICRQCGKQMQCINCTEPLEGSVQVAPKASKNNVLACQTCDASYGWSKDPKDSGPSVMWNGKLIACSDCKSYFKVVKKHCNEASAMSLKTSEIQVLLREI